MGGMALQFLAAFAASFGCFVNGLLSTWPSYTLELYQNENTTLLHKPMTELEATLTNSLPSLGAMLGTVYGGPLIDKIGRQKGGVVHTLPFILAWSTVLLTKNTTLIIIARFVMGMPVGAFMVFGPIFISEVADDNIRGLLASGPILFYCLGSVISYLLGWFLSFYTILVVNLACSIISCVSCYMVVESPIYLVRQGKETEARQSIAKYKGVTPESKIVLQELARIRAQVNPAVEHVPLKGDAEKAEEETNVQEEFEQTEKKQQHGDEEPEPKKMSSLKLLFTSPSSRRAFTVVATHLTLQVFMGCVPVMVNAGQIFEAAAPNLSRDLCSVLLGLMLSVGAIITAIIADKAGRRILLITSSILVGIFMASLGFQQQTKFGPSWIAVAIILMFCLTFAIGSGSVPYVLLAESFIPEVQSIASMLLIEWVWFTNFVILAIFPVANNLLGFHGTCYIFAGVAVVNAVLGFLFVPETKGLSSEQIQEAYLRRRK